MELVVDSSSLCLIKRTQFIYKFFAALPQIFDSSLLIKLPRQRNRDRAKRLSFRAVFPIYRDSIDMKNDMDHYAYSLRIKLS